MMDALPEELKLHCFVWLGRIDYVSLRRARMVCKGWDIRIEKIFLREDAGLNEASLLLARPLFLSF